jgi:colicin import membrane protein
MTAQDNDSSAHSGGAVSSTSALKWVVIAILALVAIYGWQQKTSAEGELTALKGEVASLQKAVDDAAEVRKSSQDEIDRLKAAVADAQRQADESKADVSTAMGKVSELDNKATGLTKENADLKGQLAAAAEDLRSKLAKAENDLKAQAAGAAEAVNKVKLELDVANKAKADAEGAASALRGEVDSLKAQIAALQKDLEAAKAAAQPAAQPATPPAAPAPANPPSP